MKLWEWQSPTPESGINYINSIATSNGKVFVTEDQYSNNLWAYAIDERNGETLWKQQFGFVSIAAHLSPPAVSDGKVYFISNDFNQQLWVLDEKDGALISQTSFIGSNANLFAPTPKNGRIYINAGPVNYETAVYAFNETDGAALWNQPEGDWDSSRFTTPAIDERYVYSHSKIDLQILDAASGNRVASIDAISTGTAGYSAAPLILGSADNVLACLTFAVNTPYYASADYQDSRYLANYSIASKALRWQSAKDYNTRPAVAKGVIYAASNRSPRSFDALDEATGQVLWSWQPGATEYFHRNVVVTNNLAFVSTDRALYAIDLATQKPVWESPTPGDVAISANGVMYVEPFVRVSEFSTGRVSAGKLIAIQLK